MKNHPIRLPVRSDLTEYPDEIRYALRILQDSRNATVGLALLASRFQFDGVSLFLLGDRFGVSCPTAHWTTHGSTWESIYRKFTLHAIDPRLTNTVSRLYPFVWDEVQEYQDEKMCKFLSHSKKFRVCSGVVISIADPRVGRAVIAWDSAISRVCENRNGAINRSLGNIALLSVILFESLLANSSVVPRRARARSMLTCRERESLQLAANGMTSADISLKLGITERTANFHIGNVIAKLNALNRGEAIARAITMGWIPQSR